MTQLDSQEKGRAPFPLKKPKLKNVARVAEMAAAVAVVVSVIYLGKQISDNTRLLRSQSHFNAISLGQRPLEILVESESLAGEVIQCDAHPDSVAAVTWERCRYFYFMQFNSWEYFYYQNIDGSIPPQLWTGADGYFKTLINTRPGYVRFWSEMDEGFAEPFKSYAARQMPQSAKPGPADPGT
jgi:hypothetical protein